MRVGKCEVIHRNWAVQGQLETVVHDAGDMFICCFYRPCKSPIAQHKLIPHLPSSTYQRVRLGNLSNNARIPLMEKSDKKRTVKGVVVIVYI